MEFTLIPFLKHRFTLLKAYRCYITNHVYIINVFKRENIQTFQDAQGILFKCYVEDWPADVAKCNYQMFRGAERFNTVDSY